MNLFTAFSTTSDSSATVGSALDPTLWRLRSCLQYIRLAKYTKVIEASLSLQEINLAWFSSTLGISCIFLLSMYHDNIYLYLPLTNQIANTHCCTFPSTGSHNFITNILDKKYTCTWTSNQRYSKLKPNHLAILFKIQTLLQIWGAPSHWKGFWVCAPCTSICRGLSIWLMFLFCWACGVCVSESIKTYLTIVSISSYCTH